MGRGTTPEIQVVSGSDKEAKAAARELGALLHLEYVEGTAPGVRRIDLTL